jgi:hypothetical protein
LVFILREATYRLNCSGEFTGARFDHSEVFEKMTDEWPSLLAPGDKIVPIIDFGRGFLVELPPRSSWISQEMLELLQSDGVIFHTDTVHSVNAGRVLECFQIPYIDIRESYALGPLATVFQTEVFAILACSDYCRCTNMHNMTICIYDMTI